jgi:hypothetical protein
VRERRWRPTALVSALTLVILAGVCFARLVVQPAAIIVDEERPSLDHANPGEPRGIGNDAAFSFLPHHLSIAKVIRTFGHVPSWDVRGFGGRPLIGNPQGGTFYPPVWLVWWSGAPAALGWLTVGHLLWGGAGMYVLLRSLGAGPWGATIAAASYQASPLLLAHTFEGHYPHVWAACWFPWAFWAFHDHRSGHVRGRLLLPIILVFTYLTGHPQEWLLLVLALTAWCLGAAWRLWRAQRPRESVAQIVWWAGTLALSIGIAAVEIAPELAVRPWLARNSDAPAGIEIPRRYHLGAGNLLQLLSPTALGGPSDYFGDDNYWETLFSIGLAPLVLAVTAAVWHRDRKQIRGWLWLMGLAIWFACGRRLLFFMIAYLTVPGVSWFRVPARALFLANLAGAALAGLGVETLQIHRGRSQFWHKYAVRFAAVFVIGLACLLSMRSYHGSDSSSRIALAAGRVLDDACFRSVLASIAAVILAGCLVRGWRNPLLAGRLLGLLVLCELGWNGVSLIQVARADPFLGHHPVSAALTQFRHDSPGAGRLRVKARDLFYSDLQAASIDVEKTNINDVFQLAHASRLYAQLYPVASRLRRSIDDHMHEAVEYHRRRIRQAVFDRFSVAYLVSDRYESDPGWPVAAQGEWHGSRWVIQRNPSVLPRAYVVPTAAIVSEDESSPRARFLDVDPRESVLMNEDPLRSLSGSPRQPFTAARWASLDPDHPVITVTTHGAGLLVVSDTWMPGWTVRVDGERTPIYRGNIAQRVIPLWQPGRHTIEMDYVPPGLVPGFIFTALSLLTWGLMCVFMITTTRTASPCEQIRFLTIRTTRRSPASSSHLRNPS